MKKLLSSKLTNWFSSFDNLTKPYDKTFKLNPTKVSNIVSEFKNDNSILSTINNIFLDLIYGLYNQDGKICFETIQSRNCVFG